MYRHGEFLCPISDARGRRVWRAILDEKGYPFKIVKFAADVTAQERKTADFEGQIAAITNSQAVIEFAMAGTILTANENFQRALGDTLAEVRGQHHSMFVDILERDSADYQAFWAKLRRDEYVAAEFRRVGKNGRDVWIQAS